jgi:alkylation response protein AidB-like acyl-CoA dehydrogenase
MTEHPELRSSVTAMRDAVAETALGRAWDVPLGRLVTRLFDVGSRDLTLARLVEGHADAVRILGEAGCAARPGLYGVWASRSAGTGLEATRAGDGWRLRGELRFASGVDVVDRALVTASTEDGEYLLFDVAADRFRPDRSTWRTPAMDASRSFTVHADLMAGEPPVGGPGFYLGRRGFVLGGLGVAAVWAGGARSVVDQVAAGLRRFSPTAHQLRRLGLMDQQAWQARTALDHVAALVDGDPHLPPAGPVAAARTTVVDACEQVVVEAGRVVGPGGLSTDERLARTLADLTVYIRQHHVDATLEARGRDLLHGQEQDG